MLPIQATIEIKNNKILKINQNSNGVTIHNNGEIYNYPNAYALPGFVDSHCHIWGLGLTMLGMPISEAKSAEETVSIIAKYKKMRGNWIFGRGWNQELWKNTSYPDKTILDDYFPDTPVLLTRIDGHADWVNSKALELSNINKNTPNPDGGEILKDKYGEPTGILIDNAMQLAEKHLPHYSINQLEEMIITSLNECITKGLTELHDMDVSPVQINIFKKLDDKGDLTLKVRSYVSAQNDQWIRDDVKPYYGNNFSVVGIKFFADGALGSHGAALLEPYKDKEISKGLILLDKEIFIDRASKGIEAGFHIATHAIGDAAVRFVLDAYEILRNKYPNAVLRIEHSQMIHPDDIKRFKELEIIAAVQPIHCISDAATMAEPRLGAERCKYSYLWKTLIENNVQILGSSDFPIESHNPLTGIDAFINRIPKGKSYSWFPDEKISIINAIESYNYQPHKLFNEKKGKIEKDYIADIIILKNNNFTYGENEIIATFVNGKCIFTK